MGAFKALVSPLKSLAVARFHLALENLAFRHQVGVLERSGKRPILRQRDRMFWVMLSALWPDWRSALVIVKPEMVLRWRRQRFDSVGAENRGPASQAGHRATKRFVNLSGKCHRRT